GGRHRPPELLERPRVAPRCLGGGEDHLGVDAHAGCGPLVPVPDHQLVVVQDRAVVHADDGPVPDGVVVGGDARVALRVVPHVEEHLRGVGGDRDVLEDRAGAGAPLVHGGGAARSAAGVADRVGSAFGDRGEQRLAGERTVDAASRAEAVSRDSTHRPLLSMVVRLPEVPGWRGRTPAVCAAAALSPDRGCLGPASDADEQSGMDESPATDPAAEETPKLELVPSLDEPDAETASKDAFDAAGPTQDPLKLYLRQIGDGRLLTAAEERELAQRKDAGDEEAKRRLVESN